LTFLNVNRSHYILLLNRAARQFQTDQRAVDMAFNAVLRWKGKVFDALASERAASSANPTPELRRIQARLKEVCTALSRLAISGVENRAGRIRAYMSL